MLLIGYILLLNTPIELTGDDNFKYFTGVSITTGYSPIISVTSMPSQNTLRWTINKQVNLSFSSNKDCSN